MALPSFLLSRNHSKTRLSFNVIAPQRRLSPETASFLFIAS
ncbi:MAG: hypothetical protein ACI957_003763, partial [Verrucomicrobiales bacterium]